MSVRSPVIVPTASRGFVSHQTKLGVSTYDLTDRYSPDTAFWKSKVLDLASPKYTPNKSYIFDKSRYGNHGTITGATWARLPSGLWGLAFNGSSYVYKSIADFRSADSLGTIGCWFKLPTSATVQTLFASADEGSAALYYFQFAINAAGKLSISQKNNDTADVVRGTTVVSSGVWKSGILVSSGTAYSIYVNGVAETLAVASGANTGDWFDDTPNRDNISLSLLRYNADESYIADGGRAILWFVSSIAFTAAQALDWHRETRGLFGV